MSKIQNALKDQCLANLQKTFKVIVTGAITPEQATQMGLHTIAGLNNIYSGSLSGEEVLALEQHQAVDSIEPNSEMNIL
jgi:hypothetical protein